MEDKPKMTEVQINRFIAMLDRPEMHKFWDAFGDSGAHKL